MKHSEARQEVAGLLAAQDGARSMDAHARCQRLARSGGARRWPDFLGEVPPLLSVDKALEKESRAQGLWLVSFSYTGPEWLILAALASVQLWARSGYCFAII